MERVVGEHQLFSQGLQELQSWVSEAQEILETCRNPTADKSVLLTRMNQLEVLLPYTHKRDDRINLLTLAVIVIYAPRQRIMGFFPNCM